MQSAIDVVALEAAKTVAEVLAAANIPWWKLAL